MEDKNTNTNVTYVSDDIGSPITSNFGVAPAPGDTEALSLDPQALTQPVSYAEGAPQKRTSRLFSALKRVDTLLILLIVLAGLGVFVANIGKHPQSQSTANVADQFHTVKLPLSGFVSDSQTQSLGVSSVIINGSLKLNDGVIVTPSVQPNSPTAGQLYFDQNTNQLAYYNGTAFVPLSAQTPSVQSVGGLTGQITLGGGLTTIGNQLTSVNNGVTSLGGQTGAISVGNGLKLSGNSISLENTGPVVSSLTAGTSNLVITNDGSGNLTISNTGAGTGTVTSSGGTSGTVPLFDGLQDIENSLISQTGTTVTLGGDTVVNGGLSLGNELTVSNGGTGTNSLAANGVVVANGTAAFTSIVAGSTGLCLLSTVGAPAWSACPGNSGVLTLNGLAGALSIANASAAGSTITIDSATTSTQGIASFNATNFTATGGAINTVQDINTTAAPNFGRLTLTSGQPTQPMLTVNNTNAGATGNLLNLQLAGVSKFSVQPDGTVSATGNINGQTISNAANFTGTLGVGGNTTLTGDLALNGGSLTSTGTLMITPTGNLTVGSTTQPLILQGSSTSLGVTSGGNSTTLDFQAPTATVTYRLPTATAGSYDVCTTAGNCNGGGGVTTSGGTINTLAKFSGSQAISNSSISDNGTTVTTSANLVVQGGQATIGVANVQTGALSLAYGAANFIGTVSQGVLTANQTYTLPNQSGTFCLSSGNCLGGASGGANTSLSNLSSVAINTTLLPGSTSIDLGSSTSPFQNLFISGSSVSPGTNNFEITGSATGARTITLPDQSGTVCLNNSTNCGFLTGVGTAFVQNGNTLGVAANLGTDDNFGVNILTNGVTRLSLDNTGAATFASNVTINGSSLNSAGALGITPGGTLTVGATTQQLTLQGNGSSTFASTSSGHTTAVGFSGTPVGTVNYNFDTSALAGTYTICTTVGNCAGSGGGVTTSGGTAGDIPVFTAGQAIGNSSISDNGSVVATTENLTVQGGTVTVGIPNSQTGTLALAYGSANDSGNIVQGTLTGNRTYTLPDASGTVCLSSGNCLGGGGGGANTSLSNLSSVAINTTLLPGSTSIDLGSSTSPFQNLFISGSSVSPGTNNFEITGSATAPRTVTLPDASGTVCLENSTNCGFTSGSGSAFVQNGNSFGAAGVLGTNDNNAIQLRTDGSTRLTIAAAGDATFSGNLAVDGSTLSSSGALNISPGGALTVGSTGETLTLQGNASTTLTATTGSDTTTVGFSGAPTGAVNYNFDTSVAAGTYTICTTIGNCAGSGSGVTTAGGTNGTIAMFTGTQIIGNSLLSQSAGTVSANGNFNLTTGNEYEINGSQISSASLSDGSNLAKLNASETFTGNNVSFQNTTNSANAFDINDLSGNQVLSVSTNTGGSLILGKASTSNGTLVFNNISNGNTVTIVPGALTGNRTLTLPNVSGTICTDSGNCAGAGATLQTAYNFSAGGTTPKIKLNSTLNGFDIQDADITIGADLFDVRASNASGLGAVMLGVGNTGAVALKNAANSHGALTVSTLGGTQIFGVDTISGAAVLGQSTVLGGSLTFNNSTNSNAITLVAAAPTGNRTLTLPDAGSTICTDSGNCAGSGSGVTTSGGTTNTIAKFTGSQSLGNSGITDNGTTVGIGELLNQSGSATSGAVATFAATDGASSGATTVQGVTINLTGTNNGSGSNTITGLNFSNAAPATNNTFNGISFGTGFNTLLGYNGTTLISGTGLLQNAALDSTQTYSNLQKVGTLSVGSITTGFGLISTGNNIVTTANLQGANLQVGASAGAGSFINDGTTLNAVDNSQSFSANGSITNVNAYSAILITATNSGLTLTLPDPSPATAGKLLYISNASSGSNLFTLSPTHGNSMPLNAGATTTLLWNGSAWTYAGTDASSILNQNSTAQTANFYISGTGKASGAFEAPAIDSIGSSLSVGGANATTLTVGNTASSAATTIQGGTGSSAINIAPASNGSIVLNATGAGTITLKSATGASSGVVVQSTGAGDNTAAFNVQTHTGGSIFNVNTSGDIVNLDFLTVGIYSGSGASLDTFSSGNAIAIGNVNASSVVIGKTTSNTATTANGTFLVQPTSGNDTTTAFRVQSSASATVLDVDTTNQRLGINTTAPSANLQVSQGTLAPGTVTNSANSTAVTGTSTTFTSTFTPGDTFTVTSTTNICTVSSITDDTHLTCASNLVNAATNSTYSTSGASRFVVQNNGTVGIGTTSPSRPLNIAVNNSTVNAPPVLIQQSGTGDASLQFQTPAKTWTIGANSASSSSFSINSSTAASTATVGSAGPGASTDNADQNAYSCSQFTAPSSGTATSISIKVGSAAASSPNNNFSMAVYTGTSTQPTTLVASTTTGTVIGNSVNTLSINFSVVNGTRYWLCANNNSTSGTLSDWSYDVGSANSEWFENGQTFSSGWSSTISNGVGSTGNFKYDIVVNYTPTGNFNSFTSSLFTLTDTGQLTLQNSMNSQSAFNILNASGATLEQVDTSGTSTSVASFGNSLPTNTQTAVNANSYSGNALVGTSNSGIGVYGQSSTGNSAVFSSASSSNTAITLAVVQNASSTADLFAVTGPGPTYTAKFKIQSNGDIFSQLSGSSATALQIENSGSANLLTIDTSATNPKINIGAGATGEATPSLLVVDSETGTTNDPSEVDGAIYYNTTRRAFRCGQGGTWRSCLGGLVSANTSIPGGNTIANQSGSDVAFASTYTVPANDCQPGRVYRITARGTWGDAATAPTLLLKVKAVSGASVTTTLGATPSLTGLSAGQSGVGWALNFDVICDTTGSSGTVEGQGDVDTFDAQGPTDIANTGTITLDTSQTQQLEITAKWGTSSASNTITMRQFLVEALGP